jgi:hypothetical protein
MQNFEIENNLEESSDEIINFFIEKNLLSEYLENQEKFPILILPEKIKSDSIESFFKIEIPKI